MSTPSGMVTQRGRGQEKYCQDDTALRSGSVRRLMSAQA
jgi:hypothetical protein